MKIFKYNLRRILTNKIRFSVIIFLPIIFILMFVFNSYNTISIGVYDNDNTQLTNNIITQLSKNKFYKVTKYNKEDLLTNITTYDLDYGIGFEKGFTEKFLNENQLLLKDYYFTESVNVFNVKSYLQGYVSNLRQIADSSNSEGQFYQVLQDYNNSNLSVTNLSDHDSQIQQSIGAIGFTVYFAIFLSVITCGIIIEDKKNGTLQRIFNTPMTIKKYLFESLLSFVVVAFIQTIVLMLIYKFVFNFYFGNGFFAIMLLLFFFGIASIALGLLVVSIVKTPIQMYLTIGVLTPPMAMLGGCYWPMDMMPTAIQNIGKLFPTSWIMMGTTDIMKGGSFITIFDNIAILLLFACAFLIGGIMKKGDFAKA